MSDDPRFKYQHTAIEATLREMGAKLGAACGPHNYGFALFLYQFGKGGGTFYVANGTRDSVLEMLKEFMERQELEAEQERRNNQRSEGES